MLITPHRRYEREDPDSDRIDSLIVNEADPHKDHPGYSECYRCFWVFHMRLRLLGPQASLLGARLAERDLLLLLNLSQ